VFDHRRRPGEGPASRNFESSYPRFPSIIGAVIIAAAILLPTLIATVGSRYSAVETTNEEVAWLVDRLTGNVYKCQAEARGKALLRRGRGDRQHPPTEALVPPMGFAC
jgi:hypothetical protein